MAKLQGDGWQKDNLLSQQAVYIRREETVSEMENVRIKYGANPDDITQIILGNLQANILKAHGRDEAYHLFLKFTTKDKHKIKARIRDHILPYITSAARQQEDALKRKEKPGYSGGLLGCFFLSATGYRALGYEKQLYRFPEASFIKGMKARENYYFQRGDRWFTISNKDPHPKDWEEGYQGEIHAMLLLAQNSREINPSLKATTKQIIASLEDIAKVFIERGRRLLTQEGEDLEHFGYRDGISNPSFFEDEIEAEQRNEYDPLAPLALVLAKDPLANEPNCYGSYFVFRKLKQDVKAFNQQVDALARQVNQGNALLTGAQIIGRFRDGTPVTKSSTPHGSDGDTNNFNYEEDNDFKCPIHAHIRRVNPRNGHEQNHRIVRRGIPYGEPGDDEVGLLFMCYQSSIHNQFEFIQRVWIDDPNNPTPNVGRDPLIGQDNAQQHWPREYSNLEAGTQAFNFGGHTSLKGGEYFFAPSLSFLRNMG